MRKEQSLESISDGKLYDINSMVKADARGCDGCSACCHDVGDLVELSPYDVFHLMKATDMNLNQLLDDHIQLRTVDKLTIPFLNMDSVTKACKFLDEKGRCSVHSNRPDICRLFPLGRVYGQDEFKYFLQVDACVKPSLGKIKVKRWLGQDRYKDHKDFVMAWYHLLKAFKFRIKFVYDEEELKELNNLFVHSFYEFESHEMDFFEEINVRLVEGKKRLGIL